MGEIFSVYNVPLPDLRTVRKSKATLEARTPAGISKKRFESMKEVEELRYQTQSEESVPSMAFKATIADLQPYS